MFRLIAIALTLASVAKYFTVIYSSSLAWSRLTSSASYVLQNNDHIDLLVSQMTIEDLGTSTVGRKLHLANLLQCFSFI